LRVARAAVAFSYLTPGPVLIVATFIGFHVAGIVGALSATLGAFLAPSALAGLAAQQVKRFSDDWRLRAFGDGAAPAAIGVLGVTVVSVGREAVASWEYLAIAVAAVVLARWTSIHPVWLLFAGGALGYVLGY
jgi:chromate transporter